MEPVPHRTNVCMCYSMCAQSCLVSPRLPTRLNQSTMSSATSSSGEEGALSLPGLSQSVLAMPACERLPSLPPRQCSEMPELTSNSVRSGARLPRTLADCESTQSEPAQLQQGDEDSVVEPSSLRLAPKPPIEVIVISDDDDEEVPPRPRRTRTRKSRTAVESEDEGFQVVSVRLPPRPISTTQSESETSRQTWINHAEEFVKPEDDPDWSPQIERRRRKKQRRESSRLEKLDRILEETYRFLTGL